MTALLTLACAAMTWLAWTWSPLLVAGTPLAELETVVRFAAALAVLALAQPLTDRLLRGAGGDHP